ncbi:MAG: DUF2630 family protein [Propionibacteriaceae bacterium]|jgi:hypothetical protein|nr:DUF2630 family protein [Propionibacteriaceae bacterium]
MKDGAIHETIDELVQRERELREALGDGTIDKAEENQRLAEVEAELDQCWDLLRRRAADKARGLDPEKTKVRSQDVVENYLE